MPWELSLLIMVVSLVVGILVEVGSKKSSYGIAAFFALGMILTFLAIIALKLKP